MQVTASSEATGHIRDAGGDLYVWATDRPCCGGTRFVRASTRPPAIAGAFVLVPHEGFRLFVRTSRRELPDELRIDLKGRRRARVEASWNGCAYVV